MYKRILSAGLLFGMIATGPPAAAASCALRHQIVEKLTSTYDESLTSTGLQNAGALVEVWSSTESGTFTILITRPDGISCVVSAGEHWTTVEPKPAPDGFAG